MKTHKLNLSALKVTSFHPLTHQDRIRAGQGNDDSLIDVTTHPAKCPPTENGPPNCPPNI